MEVLNVPAWVILKRVSMYFVNLPSQLYSSDGFHRTLTIRPRAWRKEGLD